MTAHIRSHASLWLSLVVLITGVLASAVPGRASQTATPRGLHPTFTKAAAFDVSPPMRVLARQAPQRVAPFRLPPERGPIVRSHGFAGDRAVQSAAGRIDMPAPTMNFEGLQNSDNPFPVAPPDPVGDVGPEPLRGDDQHRLGRLLARRARCNSARWTWARSGRASASPTAPTSVATPSCSTTSSPTAGSSPSSRPSGPTFYNCVAVSHDARPDRRLLPVRVPDRRELPRLPEVRRLAERALHQHPGVRPGRHLRRRRRVRVERDQMLAGNPDAARSGSCSRPGRRPWITGDGLLPADLDGKPPAAAGTPELLRRLAWTTRARTARRPTRSTCSSSTSTGPRPTASTFTFTGSLPVARVRLDLPVRAGELARLHPAAGHRRTGSTSSPTGSGRPGGWPTATSAPTSRW